ncbi:hypothetical protein F5972_07785 [Microbispora cellulosiformans]|uniref:Uncharacterized protein n=1 Tax=Microbispora cellulosiformans TaxID=2614688 RepID=A0A5J5KBE0_9ACTN|nr:DUF6203 family protein [Microbispora cellulosiformans]KAA9380968.1 hypothetical protein F5972_07785 [Microbispora cellulosiformans]
MKRILQLVVTRWLARTPIGMVVLGLGWLFARKRRADQRQQSQTQVRRAPGRRSDHRYDRRRPVAGGRR